MTEIRSSVNTPELTEIGFSSWSTSDAYSQGQVKVDIAGAIFAVVLLS